MKFVIAAVVFFLGSPVCSARETNQAETQKQKQLAGFEWLNQFDGVWATENDGTMNTRVIGQRWVINEISFQNGVYSVQTIGYDAEKRHFIGTWVDASASYVWRYTGSLDSTGNILVLETTGPDMNEPTKTIQYRDTYEFISKNEIAVATQMLDDKNQWQTFNKSKMTRKVK